MSKPKPTNKKLYDSIKAHIRKQLKKGGKRWSARASQQLVNRYIKRGGKYSGSKKGSSLSKWEKQKWVSINSSGTIVGPCGSSKTKSGKQYRCLPEARAKRLTKSQRASTARKKLKTPNKVVRNTKRARKR